MSAVSWIGPSGTAGRPKSGYTYVATNWSTGAVPGSGDDVFFNGGRYQVTTGGQTLTAHSLSIGYGVVLQATINSQTMGGSLAIFDTSLNSGTVQLVGAYIDLRSTLVNDGNLYGLQSSYYALIAGGAIQNNALISDTDGSSRGGFELQTTIDNAASGVITTKGGGEVYLELSVTNQGKISAVNGGLIGFHRAYATGSTTNLSNSGVLTGGTWEAIGSGSRLFLNDYAVTELGSGTTVNLSGNGSIFGVLTNINNGAETMLESSLGTIDAGAVLQVLAGRSYTTSKDLHLDGTLQLGGGPFSSGTIFASSGSVIIGTGTISSAVNGNGCSVTAASASQTLTFTGSNLWASTFAGRGTINFAGGSDELENGTRLAALNLTFSGASVTFDTSFNYGRTFKMSGGVVSFDGSHLTLSGTSTLSGGTLSANGVLYNNGGMTIAGTAGPTVTGGTRLTNTKTIIQTGMLTLGGTGGASGSVYNASAGTWNFTADGSIVAAAGGFASVLNAGLLEKTGGTGTTTVAGTITNNGQVAVGSGTLDFTGTVTNSTDSTGSFSIGSQSTLEFGGAVKPSQTVSFASQSDATLLLDMASTFRATVADFAAGDDIVLTGFADTARFSYTSNTNGTDGGLLRIASGDERASITLAGGYTASDFHLATSGGNTTVTLASAAT